MDNIDLDLLIALEQDGRQSFAKLADTVGLSKTPCWQRVQNLEKAGMILGYRAVIDPVMLDLKVAAYVQVAIAAGARDDFERAVVAHPAIIECTTMAGEADYMLKVICKDVEVLDELLRYHLSFLPGVQRSTTLICLKTIKREAPVTGALNRGEARSKGGSRKRVGP